MLQPKQRLGDFEIIRLLGKGGMGEVYEAQQFHPERRVALKVLAPWLAEDDAALERFWREANVPAQLDHPGVVRIIQTGKTDDIAYYAMQLVRGISLSDLIKKSNAAAAETIDRDPSETSQSESATGPSSSQAADTQSFDSSPLPSVVTDYRLNRFKTLAKIGADAARALDSAHRQGYLHRDIKPSNLMIDHHNQVYLVDFGLTRALLAGSGTHSGAVIGTPWYMSPEQALGHPLDGRSDIYSLGVTLYQLATCGKGPYSAKKGDTDAVLREVRSGSRTPIRQLAPNVPAAVEQIIIRATEVDPDKRYETAGEMADDLECYLRSGSAPTPRKESVANTRLRLVIGASALLVLVATAGAIWGLSGKKEGTEPKPLTGPASTTKEPFQRERPLGTRVNLLRIDHQPIEHRVLVGEGNINALPTELVLRGKSEQPYFVALDQPRSADFEFAVECRAVNQKEDLVNELGLFFGWRDSLPLETLPMRFFAVRLDTRPTFEDKYGRLYFGTWQFNPGGPREQDLRLLMKAASWIPLADSKTRKTGDWHQLRVRVHGRRTILTVDEQPEQVLDIGIFQQKDAFVRTSNLDSQGMLGIWVRNGNGHFRSPMIMTLGAEN